MARSTVTERGCVDQVMRKRAHAEQVDVDDARMRAVALASALDGPDRQTTSTTVHATTSSTTSSGASNGQLVHQCTNAPCSALIRNQSTMSDIRRSGTGGTHLLKHETTFLDACIVPVLLTACIHAMDHLSHDSGVGLKTLRLVNRGMGATTQQAVQQFTLRLGSWPGTHLSPSDDPTLLVFLNASRLQCLRIIFPLDTIAAVAFGTTPCHKNITGETKISYNEQVGDLYLKLGKTCKVMSCQNMSNGMQQQSLR